MCTVVVRSQPDRPVLLLALRDELASRAFDLPDEWWPDQPGVIGGRDRSAGGTWCATDLATGTTAVVLNRPERRTAGAGAPSRGVLPLLALRAGAAWTDQVDVAPMAGFNLGLITSEGWQWWSWDGSALAHEAPGPGTWMLTPRGRRTDPLDPRLLAEDARTSWIDVVRSTVPSPDPADGVVVRREVGDDSYETVFGQVIEARPGHLRLDHLRRVARDPRAPWTTRTWTTRG